MWDGKERRKRDERCQDENVALILAKIDEQGQDIKAIYKAIYVGNGNQSIMVRLSSLEITKSILAFVGGAVVLEIIGLIFLYVKK